MKPIAILTAASLVFVLAACGNGEPTSVPQEGTATASGDGAQAPAVAPPSQAVSFVPDANGEMPAGGGCALDAVDGALAAAATPVGDSAVLSGWAAPADPAAGGDAALVLVGTEGRYAATLVRSVERPDVAEALQREDARMSGFEVAASFAPVAPGQYAVHVRLAGMDCDTGKALVVAGG